MATSKENAASYGRGKKKKSAVRKAARTAARVLLIALETVLLVALALYGAMTVLAKGPSVTARDQFVMSMHETSALKFIPSLLLSEEEIAEIESSRSSVEYQETDTSLITINTNKPTTDPSSGPVADAWGLIDEDGDGIVIDPVRGEGYNGYMMVVYDASRVIMGCVPSSFEKEGYTLAEMVQHFDGVAGINAGGFLDPGGWGNGATPDSMVVYEGKLYYERFGLSQYGCFVGFDDEYKMHVGQLTSTDIKERKIQYGVCFGPALVLNGKAVDPSGFASGDRPRAWALSSRTWWTSCFPTAR